MSGIHPLLLAQKVLYVNITNISATNTQRAGIGGTSTTTYQLNSNGSLYANDGTDTITQRTGEWRLISPSSDYEAYATWSGSGGTIGGSATGTWLGLGTTREWTLTATNSLATRTLTVKIRRASTSFELDTADVVVEVDSSL